MNASYKYGHRVVLECHVDKRHAYVLPACVCPEGVSGRWEGVSSSLHYQLRVALE